MKRNLIAPIFPILHKDFFKLSPINITRKILESALSLILIFYVLIYTFTPYTKPIEVCSQDYFKKAHVVISCEDVQAKSILNMATYKFLSVSLNDDELGMTGITNKIFINSDAINKYSIKEKHILIHELEHINQRQILGIFKYFLAPAWVLEGGAEYFRGQPTLNICNAFNTWGATSKQQFYFESWVKAYHLLEVKNISYEDFLAIKSETEYEINKNKVFSIFCKDKNLEND